MASAKCKYSKKFLPLVESKYKELGIDGFKGFMLNTFENGDIAYSNYIAQLPPKPLSPDGNIGGETQSPPPIKTPSTVVPNEPPMAMNNKGSGIDTKSKSILGLYVGRAQDLTLMENKFKTELVRRAIFDRNANGGKGLVIEANQEVNGMSNLNRNILSFKRDLMNTIRKEVNKDLVAENITDIELQNALAETFDIYETLDNIKKKELLNEYVILSRFDELLNKLTPFVEVKSEFKDYDQDVINKYVYKGASINFAKSWSQDETSDTFKEVSDLARVLLDTFPEVTIDQNGNVQPIDGTSINAVGFTSAMASLKQMLQFPPVKSSNNENVVDFSKIKEQLYRGANIDMSYVIQSYIDYLNQDKSITDKRRTYLINKLWGIKHYIYDSNLSRELKDTFTAMFYKNVPISYMSYSYDAEQGAVAGRELDRNLVDNQKSRLRDLVAASVDQLRTNPEQYQWILDKYGITISENRISFNRLDAVGNPIESGYIDYNYETIGNVGRNVFKTNLGAALSNNTTEELIRDLLYLVVPEDSLNLYAQIQGVKLNEVSLFGMYSNIIGLTLTAANSDPFINSTYTNRKSGLIDVKPYGQALDPVAKVFSIIYGADCTSTIRNAAGNGLPLYQLISLVYNFDAIEHEIDMKSVINGSYHNIYQANLLFKSDLLTQPMVRSDTTVGKVTKKPSQLTFNEASQLAIVNDFFQQFNKPTRDSTRGVIYFQNTTFSDKNSHYLAGFRLSGTLYDPTIKEKTTLDELLKDCINNNNFTRMEEIFQDTRKKKMNLVVQNLLNDYSDVFDVEFNSLEEVNEYFTTNKITPKVLQQKFEFKDVDLFPDIHYYVPKESDQVRVNETILNWYNTFNDKQKTLNRLNRNKAMFIKQLVSNNFYLNTHDSRTISDFGAVYPTWVDEKTGKIKLFEAFDKDGNLLSINSNNAEDLFERGIKINLHPVLNAYFMSDIILSNEFNSMMIGEVYAHPNKVKSSEFESEDYYEFSEANRLIAQNKRAVIYGATHHPFLQGMKYGVAENINIAVINDISGAVQNILGDDTQVDSMDGSGFSHPLQAREENVSLCDAAVGYDKKTIMHDIDPRYGRPTLLKWAVYALTNARRRLAWGAKASAENLYKKMSNGTLDNVKDFSKIYNDYVSKKGYIYFQDSENAKYFKILSVSADGHTRQIIEVDNQGKELNTAIVKSETITKNTPTLYNADQLFGGAWTMSLINNELKFTEANLDVLEHIVAEYNCKNSFIGYAVNKSAIKVGAGNINSSDSYYNDDELSTIKMSTKFGGVQMDADHELDLAEVTEMTQMLSALIEGGKSTELVDKIYSEIGESVKEALSAFNIAIKSGNNEDLYKILGKALVESFQQNDRDTLGLAQAFIAKANDSLQNANIEFKIPFSAQTVKGAFIATITSILNKKGIRRKYSGFAGVLVPSYDMIVYHSIGDKSYTYQGIIKKFNEARQSNPLLAEATNAQLTNDYSINGVINPFLRRINQNEIDFEDTIVIVPKGEIPTKTNAIEKKIIGFNDYDKAKSDDLFGYDIYVFDTKPKNLKGFNTKFTINFNGVESKYSLYDLPSVRLSYLIKNKKSRDKKGILNNLDQDQLFNTYVPSTFIKSSDYANNLISWQKESDDSKLRYLHDETASVLKAIKYKTLFNFGKYGMVQATSFETEAAQIIMGRNYASQFGLKQGDEIADILEEGLRFFKNRLNARYEMPEDIHNDLYDAVLYTGDGDKVLVKYSNQEDATQLFNKINNESKYCKITEGNVFKIVGNSVYYGDQEFTNTDQKQFYKVTNEYGDNYNLIIINDIDRLNELRKSSLFESYRLHYTESNYKELNKFEFRHQLEDDSNGSKIILESYEPKPVKYQDATWLDFADNEAIWFNRRLDKMATHKFDSFKKSLNFVGARIPTQAMQSFMPLRVVVFTDSEINDVYVPRQQTWLQGSDYDKTCCSKFL